MTSDRLREIKARMAMAATGDDDGAYEESDWRWLLAEVDRLYASRRAVELELTATRDRLTAQRARLLEAARDALDGSVNASTYPDGPCLEVWIRDGLRAAIAAAEEETHG